MDYGALNGWLWGALLLYWAYASRTSGKTVFREKRFGRLTHLILVVGMIVLINPHFLKGSFLAMRAWPQSDGVQAFGVAVTAFGCAWALFARAKLGTNWSGEITLKENHQLIRSGPYQYSRHPIYTGFLVGLLGTAISVGELRGVIVFEILWIAIIRKSGAEEELMLKQFPEEYPVYSQQVKRLIPHVY
jgi:protein-S-isoprenylcysteine O-methyltransferase Ste14